MNILHLTTHLFRLAISNLQTSRLVVSTIGDGNQQVEEQEKMEFQFYSIMDLAVETHSPSDSVVELAPEKEEDEAR